MTPNISSSCLMAAEKVGWLTLQASAARLKCFSRSSAMMYSSLSIMAARGARPGPPREISKNLREKREGVGEDQDRIASGERDEGQIGLFGDRNRKLGWGRNGDQHRDPGE